MSTTKYNFCLILDPLRAVPRNREESFKPPGKLYIDGIEYVIGRHEWDYDPISDTATLRMDITSKP